MNTKYSFRAIQQGQTQQSHVVQAGAGQNGQALVLRAAEGTRYQLADLLTLTSPKKLQIKRVGQDLLLALPGNEVSSPDIVIKDYFNFKDMSLSGLAATGEPMVYDTSSSFNLGQSATGIRPESIATDKTTAATLAASSEGWFDSGWGLAALGGGVALLAAAGSGGGSSSSGNASLSKITAYIKDPTQSGPTVSDFGNAGVSGVDNSNIGVILILLTKTQLDLGKVKNLQTLVDSFNKVVAEANGTSADATTQDPTKDDYGNIMGGTTPKSLESKPQAVALLNDRIKALNTTEVDSYLEIKALADAVDSIATLAQSAPSTTGTATAGATKTQLDLLIGTELTATNLNSVSDAIRANADDLSTLNTTAKLTALVKAYNTILAEANGSTADTTVANPTADNYAAIGADIGAAKTDAAALARLNAVVGNLGSSAVDTVDEINKLAATLDKILTVAKLDSTAVLSDTQIFSVDELKNLGLTGFTASEVINTQLALAVSQAIRDKAEADVLAGDVANGKLDTTSGTRVTWSQTQLERLQTLVSQEIIKNYKVDSTTAANTTTAPTAADWANVGVFHNPATNTDSASNKWSALSSAEVASLNSAVDKLDAAATDSTTELQAIAESYARILQEANGIAVNVSGSPDPSAADLARVGVSGAAATAGEAANLLLDLIANRSSSEVDTVGELQALADTAAKVVQAAAGTDVAFTVAELQAIGLSGASANGTSNNLIDFVNNLKASADGGSEVNTLAELKALMSLSVVQAWARDVNPDANTAIFKTATTPTVQDYKDMGLTRPLANTSAGTEQTDLANLSQADVNALNDAIDTLVDNSSTTANDDALINSLSKVQAIAKSYFAILNEANGSASDYTTGNTVQTTFGGEATLGVINDTGDAADVTDIDLNKNPTALDYTRIGVKNPESGTFDDARTSLLNTLIAEKTFAQVDTVKEIQALADTVDKVLALATRTGNTVADADKLTLSQLQTDLGLSGITTANLGDVLLAIQKTADDKSAADSLAELQSVVSFTRITRYADDSSSASNAGGAPLASDWRAIISLHSELEANVNAYNSAVDASTPSGLGQLSADTSVLDLKDLQSLVSAYNDILRAADGNRLTAPTDLTAADYEAVLGASSATYKALLPAGTDAAWQDLMVNVNSGLTSDKVDTVSDLSAMALAAARVMALSAVESTASTNEFGAASGLNNAANVTKADLALLGLNTNDIGTGYRTYESYELGNILADIQNLTPSQVSDLGNLQQIINRWAI